MRFSTSAILLALPLLAVAQDFDQYKAQFQNFLGQYSSYIPNPSKHDPIGAAEAKAGSMRMNVLTVENWNETLRAPVKAESTTPEEWWVLVSGRNKTCFGELPLLLIATQYHCLDSDYVSLGHCLKVEAAFNQSAAKLAVLPNSPHIGYLNCDDQPILCNAWSAGPGTLWVVEMLPSPAPIDIYTKRMNLTTTDSDTFLELYKTKDDKTQFNKKEGYFHPFDGELAKYNVAIPVGYVIWGFSNVPSWAMMLIVSFVSRSFM